MFREVFIPTLGKHTVSLPKEFYGKTIEVIAFPIKSQKKKKTPPRTSLNAVRALAGAFPDMTSLKEIRERSWPSKW